MEPISIIISALAAGAIAGAKDTTATIVKDAYQALKTLIKEKFAAEGKPDDSTILEQHEKKLDSKAFKELLKEELINIGVDKDEIIIKAAQELLKTEKPEESATGKYNTIFQGEVKGIQVGDKNTQTNTFS